MKFSEYPKEIKNKVRIYTEKVGNTFNEETFNNNIRAGNSSGGFNWDGSPEGHTFWSNVLTHQKFDLFYEKYPKAEFKAGDRVRIISNIDKTIDKTWSNTECIGVETVLEQLHINRILEDETFTLCNNRYGINFRAEMLEKVSDEPLIVAKETPMTAEEGKLEKENAAGVYYRVMIHDAFDAGEEIVLTRQDDSAYPGFKRRSGKGNEWFVSWTSLVKINNSLTTTINKKEDGKSINSNSNSIIVSPIIATITCGSASGRTLSTSSGSKIKLGS